MAGAAHHVITDFAVRGRAFWLPPGGWGNGLDCESWVAIIDVRGELPATLLLLELRDARVPGYAAVLRSPRAVGDGRLRSDRLRVRVWVGGDAYGRGEATILRAVPGLMRQFGPTLLA
jgi:hypothetical protein